MSVQQSWGWVGQLLLSCAHFTIFDCEGYSLPQYSRCMGRPAIKATQEPKLNTQLKTNCSSTCCKDCRRCLWFIQYRCCDPNSNWLITVCNSIHLFLIQIHEYVFCLQQLLIAVNFLATVIDWLYWWWWARDWKCWSLWKPSSRRLIQCWYDSQSSINVNK